MIEAAILFLVLLIVVILWALHSPWHFVLLAVVITVQGAVQ